MTDLTLERIGRRMNEACPAASRALMWGIIHPLLRADSVVAVTMWRDGHMEQTTVDGTVIRSGPPGCDCEFCA